MADSSVETQLPQIRINKKSKSNGYDNNNGHQTAFASYGNCNPYPRSLGIGHCVAHRERDY